MGNQHNLEMFAVEKSNLSSEVLLNFKFVQDWISALLFFFGGGGESLRISAVKVQF